MTLARSPLILARKPGGRRADQCRITSSRVTAEIDERGVQQASGLAAPGEIASLLAREKALSVSARQPGKFVIGADQTLALGERLSASRTAARRLPRNCVRFAGRSHELHSAVAVARDGKILFEAVAIAGMTMRRLGDAEIDVYLDEAGDAVTSSVGAYQLEGLGVHLFERIEGDHFTHPRSAAAAIAGRFCESERLLGMLKDAVHAHTTHSSCPRRRASSTPRRRSRSLALRNTGSSAFADDDDQMRNLT